MAWLRFPLLSGNNSQKKKWWWGGGQGHSFVRVLLQVLSPLPRPHERDECQFIPEPSVLAQLFPNKFILKRYNYFRNHQRKRLFFFYIAMYVNGKRKNPHHEIANYICICIQCHFTPPHGDKRGWLSECVFNNTRESGVRSLAPSPNEIGDLTTGELDARFGILIPC